MDQISNGIRCYNHPYKQAIYFSYDDGQFFSSFSLVCDICGSSNYKHLILLPISQILDSNPKTLLQNWPPLINKNLLQEMINTIESAENERIQDRQYQCQTFFQKWTNNIVQQIKKIEKLFLMSLDQQHFQPLMDLHQNISSIDKLKHILQSNNQQQFQQLKQELLNTKDQNEQAISACLKQFENSTYLFDENQIEQEFIQISEHFETFSNRILQKEGLGKQNKESNPSQECLQKDENNNPNNLFNLPSFSLNSNNNNPPIFNSQQQPLSSNPYLNGQQSILSQSQQYNFQGQLQQNPIVSLNNNINGQPNNGFSYIQDDYQQSNPPQFGVNNMFSGQQSFNSVLNEQQLQQPKQQQYQPISQQQLPPQQQMNFHAFLPQIPPLDITANKINQPQYANNNHNNQYPQQQISKPVVKEEEHKKDSALDKKEDIYIGRLCNGPELNIFSGNQYQEIQMLKQQQNYDIKRHQSNVLPPKPNNDPIIKSPIRKPATLQNYPQHSNNNNPLTLLKKNVQQKYQSINGQLIQSLGTIQPYLKEFKYSVQTIELEQENQKIGIIDYYLTQKTFKDKGFRFQITYPDASSLQAFGIADKQVLNTIIKNENISLCDNKGLYVISNNGYRSFDKKEDKDFFFQSEDVLEVFAVQNNIHLFNCTQNKTSIMLNCLRINQQYYPCFLLSYFSNVQIDLNQ